MPALSARVVVSWLSLIFPPVVSGLFAWSGSGHISRRRTDARRGTPPWSVPRCTRAAARDVYGRAARLMRGPPRAHARRAGATGGGIPCGVQARIRPRRNRAHGDGLSRRSQRRSCPAAAMRPASLLGTGLWPAERGPCRRPWRRSGGNRREAQARGRRGVSLALPPFFL